MSGYTIAYWGDTNEVAYLTWDAGNLPTDDPEQDSYAAQFERINPAFARFLTHNHVTEILEHCPAIDLAWDTMNIRLDWWRDRLREQGYFVED